MKIIVDVSLCSTTITDSPTAGKTYLLGDLGGDLMGAGPVPRAMGRLRSVAARISVVRVAEEVSIIARCR